MEDKTKLFVFARKEVALIFIFMILVSISSFLIGVKIGKEYSYEMAGYTQEQRDKIELKSREEEVVSKLETEINEKQNVNKVENEKETIDDTYRELKEEFNKLEKHGKDYGTIKPKKAPSKESISEQIKTFSRMPIDDSIKFKNAKLEESVPQAISSELKNIGKKDKLAGNYTVQLGSFPNIKEAEEFADGFKVRGYNPIINEVDLKTRGLWYRVSLGIFESIAEAKTYIVKEKSLFRGTDYVIGKFD